MRGTLPSAHRARFLAGDAARPHLPAADRARARGRAVHHRPATRIWRAAAAWRGHRFDAGADREARPGRHRHRHALAKAPQFGRAGLAGAGHGGHRAGRRAADQPAARHGLCAEGRRPGAGDRPGARRRQGDCAGGRAGLAGGYHGRGRVGRKDGRAARLVPVGRRARGGQRRCRAGPGAVAAGGRAVPRCLERAIRRSADPPLARNRRAWGSACSTD